MSEDDSTLLFRRSDRASEREADPGKQEWKVAVALEVRAAVASHREGKPLAFPTGRRP